jgi:Tfp pilus assembly protein PilE
MRSSKGVTIIGLAITVVILGTLALVALKYLVF